MDGVEQGICQKIESEWAWQRDELLNQLRAYAARLVQYSIKSEFERLKLSGNDALARLRAANIRAEADLGPLRHMYVGARDELAAFRKRHRLQRLARTIRGRGITLGLMFVLIAVESVINGAFFATGSEFGLAGGIGVAVGISFVNVIAAFLLGLFPIRWINHRNWLLKALGLTLAVGGVAALVGLQVFAAQYREAMAAVGEAQAMSVAIQRLLTTPWSVSAFSSIYLFGLGLVFCLYAFWKGAHFDDPYPGYGAMSRRMEHAQQEYSDTHAGLFDELQDVKDETVRSIDDGVQRLPSFPQNAAKIRQQRAALIDQFRTYEASVETAANQLLARYRDRNREHRSTPAPPHFNTTWRLTLSFVDNPQFGILTADVPETATDVDAPLAELAQLSKSVLTEYESLLSKYPHPTQMA